MAIGKCAKIQLKLIELQKLSAKALQHEAKEEFGEKLTLEHGKKWLCLKVSYLWQRRIYGDDLSQVAINNEKKLDNPQYIKEIKEKEVLYGNALIGTGASLKSKPSLTKAKSKQKTNKNSTSPNKKRGTCARVKELYSKGLSKIEAIKTLEKEGFTFSKITVNVQWNKAAKAC